MPLLFGLMYTITLRMVAVHPWQAKALNTLNIQVAPLFLPQRLHRTPHQIPNPPISRRIQPIQHP